MDNKQTAVEWLYDTIIIFPKTINDLVHNARSFNQAKAMEKEQMIKFAEFISKYPDKNRNYLGEMLHAKSKYEETETTINLLKVYYNETYGKE